MIRTLGGATTASASHISLAPSGACSAAASSSSTAPWVASTALAKPTTTARVTNKQRKDLPDMREIKRPKRADVVQAVASQEVRDEALPTLSRVSVHPAVGCRPFLCGPPGLSSTRPCSVQVPVLPLAVEKVFCVSATSPRHRTSTCWPPVGDAVRPRFPQGSAFRLQEFGRVDAGSI